VPSSTFELTSLDHTAKFGPDPRDWAEEMCKICFDLLNYVLILTPKSCISCIYFTYF